MTTFKKLCPCILLILLLLIPALGVHAEEPSKPTCEHQMEEVVVPPDCSHGGYTISVCVLCGFQETTTYTEPLGHDLHTEEVAATCETPGLQRTTCSCCSYLVEVETTPALGHDWQETVESATCTARETLHRTCTRCGKEEVEYGTETAAHVFREEVWAPTCTSYGFTLYTCTACGMTYRSTLVEPTGHTWVETWVPPTDSEAGYLKYTCDLCGFSYATNFLFTDAKELEEPHTHDYSWAYLLDTENQTIRVSYVCSCGEIDVREVQLYSLSEGTIERQVTTKEGYASYAEFQDGTIYIYDPQLGTTINSFEKEAENVLPKESEEESSENRDEDSSTQNEKSNTKTIGLVIGIAALCLIGLIVCCVYLKKTDPGTAVPFDNPT